MANEIPKSQAYPNENLVGSRSVTGYRKAVDGDYHEGQILAFVTASNLATPWVDAGSGGEEVIRMVCMKTVTITGNAVLPCYLPGSGVQKAGIVDAAGDTLEITDAILVQAQNNNIILEDR